MQNPLAWETGRAPSANGASASGLMRLARRTELRGDRLLDIGCGDGAYTVRLAGGFGQVDAIDIQPDRLALLADRSRGTGSSGSPTARASPSAEMSADKARLPGRDL